MQQGGTDYVSRDRAEEWASRPVVVTGGSGFIGSHLVEALTGSGARVTNLDIQPPSRGDQRSEWIDCDIRDPAQMAAALNDVRPEFVFNLAAVAELSAPSSAMAVNTRGLINIIEYSRTMANSPLIVHFSTQLVVEPGYRPSGPLDFAPYSEYGATKAESERLLHGLGGGLDWLIVRPTTVWGPLHPTFAGEVWRYLAKGFYLVPAGCRARRSYGYVGNVVEQVMRLAELARTDELVVGRTLYVGDEPVQTTVWLDAFSHALRGGRTRRVPTTLLTLLAEAGELSGRLGLPSPLNRERLFRMTTDYAVDMRPTFELVGQGSTGIDEGVTATVRWLRNDRNPVARSTTSGSNGAKRLIMVGPFPPPLGGAAMMNEGVRRALGKRNILVRSVDTSGPTLSHERSLRYHLTRAFRNSKGVLTTLVESRRVRALFLLLDGGYGAWYSLAYATVAALRYRRVFVYHVTCLYVDNYALAARLITRVLGGKATHIFLTEGMARNYSRRYGAVNYLVLSNAWFATPTSVPDMSTSGPHAIVRLGHLSNLCEEKGFFRVAEAFDLLRKLEFDVELHLAGPALGEHVMSRIEVLKLSHPGRVVYHGPLYDDAKRAFYSSLDVFLFPTNFVQEAAPNVLYEAAASGVPSLSVDRGCIPEMMTQLCGDTCPTDADFGQLVASYIGDVPAPLTVATRCEVRRRFDSAQDGANGEADQLLGAIDDACLPAGAGGRTSSADGHQ